VKNVVRNSLIIALALFGSLNLAGGESAAAECALVNKQCPPYERDAQNRYICYPCTSSSNSRTCTKGDEEGVCGYKSYFSIKQVQQELKKKSYNIDVTGKFDERTKKAIESFQQQQNIKKDGIVGPDTLGKLMPQRAP
jgi:murein L,D-transpeptidase YcbB/YkuD